MVKPASELYVKLLLDSGAFSAWNRKVELSVKDYAKFVRKNEKLITNYVTMDVLPFGKESQRTAEQNETCANQSYDNHKYMKDQGLNPIPVFHQDEDMKWLDLFLENGEPYIGVSTRKDIPVSAQLQWLDRCFTKLTDKSGRPVVKVHGFGITAPVLLFRYPFYTVDSTTWALGAGYGQIILPALNPRTNEFVYDERPNQISMSDAEHSPNYFKRGYVAFGPNEQKLVDEFVKELQATLGSLRYDTEARRRAYLHYYEKLIASIEHVRFPGHTASLSDPVRHSIRKPISIPKLQLMYATAFRNKGHNELLTEFNIRTRLLSYFDVRDFDADVFEEYIMTGRVRNYKPRISVGWHRTDYKNMRRLYILKKKEIASGKAAGYNGEETT